MSQVMKSRALFSNILIIILILGACSKKEDGEAESAAEGPETSLTSLRSIGQPQPTTEERLRGRVSELEAEVSELEGEIAELEASSEEEPVEPTAHAAAASATIENPFYNNESLKKVFGAYEDSGLDLGVDGDEILEILEMEKVSSEGELDPVLRGLFSLLENNEAAWVATDGDLPVVDRLTIVFNLYNGETEASNQFRAAMRAQEVESGKSVEAYISDKWSDLNRLNQGWAEPIIYCAFVYSKVEGKAFQPLFDVYEAIDRSGGKLHITTLGYLEIPNVGEDVQDATRPISQLEQDALRGALLTWKASILSDKSFPHPRGGTKYVIMGYSSNGNKDARKWSELTRAKYLKAKLATVGSETDQDFINQHFEPKALAKSYKLPSGHHRTKQLRAEMVIAAQTVSAP